MSKAEIIRLSLFQRQQNQKITSKTYANKLTQLKALFKKFYLESEVLNSRQDMQKFWSILKTLITKKPQSNAPDLVENEIGANTTEPNEVARVSTTTFVL